MSVTLQKRGVDYSDGVATSYERQLYGGSHIEDCRDEGRERRWGRASMGRRTTTSRTPSVVVLQKWERVRLPLGSTTSHYAFSNTHTSNKSLGRELTGPPPQKWVESVGIQSVRRIRIRSLRPDPDHHRDWVAPSAGAFDTVCRLRLARRPHHVWAQSSNTRPVWMFHP